MLTLMSSSGKSFSIDCRTARAPATQPGHVGDNNVTNRSLSLFALKWSRSGSSDFANDVNSKKSPAGFLGSFEERCVASLFVDFFIDLVGSTPRSEAAKASPFVDFFFEQHPRFVLLATGVRSLTTMFWVVGFALHGFLHLADPEALDGAPAEIHVTDDPIAKAIANITVSDERFIV